MRRRERLGDPSRIERLLGREPAGEPVGEDSAVENR
jgi:hypothetical protein